jgi:hypothetical protein
MKTHQIAPPYNKFTKVELEAKVKCIQAHLNSANEILNGLDDTTAMATLIEVIQTDINVIMLILAAMP